MHIDTSLRSLTDAQLLGRLRELLRQSRGVEAELIAHIAEVDARRLYLREAAPSMHAYAVRRLHLSEAEAYLRITVARASRKHPELLAMLAEGRLHLSGAALIAPHLTGENRERVLARAAHKSKREIEELVAELAPRPDVRDSIRKLPELRPAPREAGMPPPGPAGSPLPAPQAAPDRESSPSQLFPERVGAPLETPAPPPLPVSRRPAVVQPLAPARYRVEFTARAALRDKLERLRALLPGADLAALIEQAVTEKLERLEAKRFAKTKAPRKTLAQVDTSPGPRRIPAPVRRAVYDRDGGRCGFVDASGRRCGERSRLEFHHRHPHGYGGDRSPGNIALRCKAHNAYLAEVDYGKAALARGPRLGPGP